MRQEEISDQNLKDKFDCLIINLIVFSSNAQEQFQFMGEADIVGEMAIDFGLYYEGFADLYLQNHLIDSSQKILLDNFGTYLQERDDNFYRNDNLESGEWNLTRQLVKKVLNALHKSHCFVEQYLKEEIIDNKSIEIFKLRLKCNNNGI